MQNFLQQFIIVVVLFSDFKLIKVGVCVIGIYQCLQLFLRKCFQVNLSKRQQDYPGGKSNKVKNLEIASAVQLKLDKMSQSGKLSNTRGSLVEYGPTIDWANFLRLTGEKRVEIMTSLQGVTPEFREFLLGKISIGSEITRNDLYQFGIAREFWHQFIRCYVEPVSPRFHEEWEFSAENQYHQESVLRGLTRSPEQRGTGTRNKDHLQLDDRPRTRSHRRQLEEQLGLVDSFDPLAQASGTSTPSRDGEFQERPEAPTAPMLPLATPPSNLTLGPPPPPGMAVNSERALGYPIEVIKQHLAQEVGVQVRGMKEEIVGEIIGNLKTCIKEDQNSQMDSMMERITSFILERDNAVAANRERGDPSAVIPTNVNQGASANAAGEAAGRADAESQTGRRADGEAAALADAESQTGRRAADPVVASGMSQPKKEVKFGRTEYNTYRTETARTSTSGMERSTRRRPDYTTHPDAQTVRIPRSILINPETQARPSTEQNYHQEYQTRVQQEHDAEEDDDIEEIVNPNIEQSKINNLDQRIINILHRMPTGGAGAKGPQTFYNNAGYLGTQRYPTPYGNPRTPTPPVSTPGYGNYSATGYMESQPADPYGHMHQATAGGMGAPFPAGIPPHHGGVGTTFHAGAPPYYGGVGAPFASGAAPHQPMGGTQFHTSATPQYGHMAGTLPYGSMNPPLSRFGNVGGEWPRAYNPGGMYGQYMGWPNMKLNKGNLEAPEFDGKANFRFWLSRFEDFLTEMRIPEYQYKQYLLNSITKGCKKNTDNFVMTEFLRHTPTAHLSYLDLVGLIDRALQEEAAESQTHRQLYTAFQRSGESIKDWHKRVYSMYLETLETCTTRGDEAAKRQVFIAARAQFMSKLNDPELRVYMEANPEPPNNFKRLLSWALHIQDSLAQCRAKASTPFLGAVYPEATPTACAAKPGAEEDEESRIVRIVTKALQKMNTESSGGGYYNPRGRGYRGGFRGGFRGNRGRGGGRGSDGGATEGATATEGVGQDQQVKDQPRDATEAKKEQSGQRSENA